MGAKSSWPIMHITLLIIGKQAEINALKDNSETKMNHFSICGDDSEFACPHVYNAFLEIAKGLNLQINWEKSYKSSSENNPKGVFGEYLKRFVVKGEVFKPLSPRLAGKFLNNPKQQLYGFVRALLYLDLDFDLNELVLYTFHKNEYDQKGELVPREASKNRDALSETYTTLYF